MEEYLEDMEDRSGMDDNNDELAYEVDDCEFDYKPLVPDVEEVDIDYQFCPDLMDWLLRNIEDTSNWAIRLVQAGKSGNLEYIMWMREQVVEMDQIVISEFTVMVKAVAFWGHRHVLEWLQAEYGTIFETSIPDCIAQNLPDICVHASKRGYLNILQWSFSNGLHMDLHKCLCTAIKHKRLDVLILLKHEYSSPDFWILNGGDIDFSHESLGSSCDIFQWVHLNGCPWSDRTYKELKKNHYKGYKGKFKEQMEWAFKNGCGDNIPVTQGQYFIPRDSLLYPPEQKDEAVQEDNVEQDDEDEQKDEAVQGEDDDEQEDEAVQEDNVEQEDDDEQEDEDEQEDDLEQEDCRSDYMVQADEESYRRKRKRIMRSVWMN